MGVIGVESFEEVGTGDKQGGVVVDGVVIDGEVDGLVEGAGEEGGKWGEVVVATSVFSNDDQVGVLGHVCGEVGLGVADDNSGAEVVHEAIFLEIGGDGERFGVGGVVLDVSDQVVNGALILISKLVDVVGDKLVAAEDEQSGEGYGEGELGFEFGEGKVGGEKEEVGDDADGDEWLDHDDIALKPKRGAGDDEDVGEEEK